MIHINEVHEEDLLDEASAFLNDHLTELQTVIAKTVMQVKPSNYNSQQKYLSDVFEISGEACWSYIKDIFYDPEISTELSDEITETMVKAAAIIVATAMFVEWAMKQSREEANDEEEEGDIV